MCVRRAGSTHALSGTERRADLLRAFRTRGWARPDVLELARDEPGNVGWSGRGVFGKLSDSALRHARAWTIGGYSRSIHDGATRAGCARAGRPVEGRQGEFLWAVDGGHDRDRAGASRPAAAG